MKHDISRISLFPEPSINCGFFVFVVVHNFLSGWLESFLSFFSYPKAVSFLTKLSVPGTVKSLTF